MVLTMLELPSNTQINKLEIEKMASGDASRGVPHEDDTSLTESEQNIENFIYDHIHTTEDNVENGIQKDHELRSEINFDGEIRDLRYADNNLNADIAKLEHNNLQELVRAKLTVIQKKTDFNLFRSENCLNSLPIFPKSRIDHYVFILVILFIETLLNAVFLKEGNDLGYIGGFVSALIITGANFLLALVIANVGIRNIHHIKMHKKIMGWFVTAGMATLLVSFVLLVGHYRDELALVEQQGIEPYEASVRADKAMIENSLGISDFFAWVLVIISILAAGIMGFKIFFSDDPYPGYGKLERKMLEVETDSQKMEAKYLDETLALIKKAGVDLMSKKRECFTKFQEYKNSIDRSVVLVSAYDNYLLRIEKMYEDLLSKYRQKNKVIRVSNYPSYFDDKVIIDRTRIREINQSLIDLDMANVADFEKSLDEVPQIYNESEVKLDKILQGFKVYMNDFSEKINTEATNLHAINAITYKE